MSEKICIITNSKSDKNDLFSCQIAEIIIQICYYLFMKLQKIPKNRPGGIAGVSLPTSGNLSAQRPTETSNETNGLNTNQPNGQYSSNVRQSTIQQSFQQNGAQTSFSKMTSQPQSSTNNGLKRQSSNMMKKKGKKQSSMKPGTADTSSTHVTDNSQVVITTEQSHCNGQSGGGQGSLVPSNIVYFDNSGIKLQTGAEVQKKTIMLQTQHNQTHPSNIPKPTNPQRTLNSSKKVSKIEIDQYIAKYNNQKNGYTPIEHTNKSADAMQEHFQNVQLQSLMAMQTANGSKGSNRISQGQVHQMMGSTAQDAKISITGTGARITNSNVTTQAFSQMASHQIEQKQTMTTHDQANRVRPKSSIPAAKGQNQQISQKKDAAFVQNMQQLNQFQIVNNSQIRTQANYSHQQQMKNDPNSQNLVINLGQNSNFQANKSVPQSAGLQTNNANNQLQSSTPFSGTVTSNIPSTAVSGARKNKIIANQQNQLNQQQNSFIMQKQMQLQNLQINQQDSSNQQVFFEKRNRSRGATNSNANVVNSTMTAGLLVTVQPNSNQTTALKMQSSPGVFSQTGQKPSRQGILSPNDPTGSLQTQGSQLIKDFNASLLQRENTNIKANQLELLNPSQIMTQIQNFNTSLGDNPQTKSVSVTGQGSNEMKNEILANIDPVQQQLMGSSLAINIAGKQMQQYGQNSALNQGKGSNSAQSNQRYQNLSQNGDHNQMSDPKLQPYNMDKENLTVKQISRKISQGQNFVGISGSHGSSQSFHGTQNMTMQLNSMMSPGIDQKGFINKTMNQVQFSLGVPQQNRQQHGINQQNTLNSVTNLKAPTELSNDIQQERSIPIAQSQKQQSAKHNQIQQMQQDNLEMHMMPSTSKFYKRTYRHYFRRRMNQMDRPIIIINFQGVLGDFFKDQGISMKQDHIMPKHYVSQVNTQGFGQNNANSALNDSQLTSLWVRIGTIDGLKYLSKHFQIVIYNKDSQFEDHGASYSQINVIQSYMQQNDITIDAIYSSSQQIQQQVQQQKISEPQSQGKKKNPDKKDETSLKQPYKPGEMWEDYKQIFTDFSLNNDNKIRDKVLFVNSLDTDYNSKQEEIKVDRMGYFLIDSKSKPAKHLVEGLPLSWETKEKELDLTKGGPLKFNQLAKQDIVTKEMPVTILIPNPRNMYAQQISFASIAKTIMTLCFLGQRKSKLSISQGYDPLNQVFDNIRYLQEFDVKVQKDQCLIQYNPNASTESRQNVQNQPGSNNNMIPIQNRNILTQNSQNSGQNQSRRGGNINQRPRSSNSHGRILNNGVQTQNSNISGVQEEQDKQKTNFQQQIKETMVIPLTDQLFQNMSWAASFDFLNQQDMQREILGLVAVKSNLIWRYFLHLLKQRSNIKQHREKRVIEIKKLLEKLDQLHNEEGKSKKQLQIQEIYEKLKKVQQNGNPLTNMMARNLKVFIKIYAEVKRKSKRELENFTEALLMDQKMAELEKQSLESRILILGINKPIQFFNTHPRVYEKVNVQVNQKKEEKDQINRLYENSVNNTNLMNSVLIHQKSRTGAAGPLSQQVQYQSISSNGENQNNSANESNRIIIDSKKISSSKAAGYGKKKSSFVAQNSGGSHGSGATTMGNSGGSNTGAIGNFSSNISSQYSRKKINGRGAEANTANMVTEGSNTRRSNQSTENQRFASSSRLT